MKLSLLISMIFGIACGDNLGGGAGGGGGDGGVGGDGGAGPDASSIACDPPAAGAPGSPCDAPEDCDSSEGAGDGRCLDAAHRGVTWPASGYCVRICGEGATDCGEGTTCFAQEGAGQVLCMPTCCEGVACADGFACSTSFLGEAIGAAVCMPGDRSAADGTPCASVAECDVDSNCEPDQSGTSGVCTTVGCTEGDDSTCAPGGDGHCVDPDGDGEEVPRCVDPCESSEDCAAGQRCDQEDMACRHAEIGEACEGEGSCGQEPWLCQEGAEFPGGHCSFPCDPDLPASCPMGTVCRDRLLEAGEQPTCVVGCESAVDTCDRMGEGYLCTDVAAGASIEFGCSADLDL